VEGDAHYDGWMTLVFFVGGSVGGGLRVEARVLRVKTLVSTSIMKRVPVLIDMELPLW
jgi:hypothetical protein